MSKIKLGIIGLGFAFDKLHFPALMELKDKYEVTAISDKDEKKLNDAINKLSLEKDKGFLDYRDLLKTDIDTVLTLVPISENFEVAKDILLARKHLIGEKPLAATMVGAVELIQLKDEYNLKVLVGENFRYTDESRIIKDLIDSNEIGDIKFFVENKISNFKEDMKTHSFASTNWRQHPVFEGGIFLDGCIHDIAKYRFLFGDIVDTLAHGIISKEDFCKYETINSILKFENNILGYYGYWNMGNELYTPKIGLRIFGSEGEIFLEDKYCEEIVLQKSSGEKKIIKFTKERGFYNELNNFYNNYFDSEDIVCIPEKEIGDMEVIFSIWDYLEG